MPESKRKTDTGSPVNTAGCGRKEAKDGTQEGENLTVWNLKTKILWKQ